MEPDFSPKTQSLEFFFRTNHFEKPLKSYFQDTDTMASEKLIPLVFISHLQSFTGDIVLKIKSKPNSIHFYKGHIIQIVSKSQRSFFGEILVEHGLSLSDDVIEVLNDTKSKKRIGEKLLEKELLSPYMLDFVLKEQMKIRLSEFMSEGTFGLKIIPREPESFKTIEVEFNKTDFVDWLVDSIQTHLDSDFWKNFYSEIKDDKVSPHTPFNLFSLSQKSFFKQYNNFFRSLNKNKKITELIKNNKEDNLKFLYFGWLVQSLHFKKTPFAVKALEPIEKLIQDILSSKDILNFLTDSHDSMDLKQIKLNYKNLVKQIHPDFLPKESSQTLRENGEKALDLVTRAYKKILKQNEDNEPSDLIRVMEDYKKGIALIDEHSYSEAFDLLSKIKDHKQAPSSIKLYLLWAELKKEEDDLLIKNNRQKGASFQNQINQYPIHLRTSYLFWFVKGIFYYKCKEYEKAKELFEKTISIESRFVAAKRELLLVKQKIKNVKKAENKGNSLFSFFKKPS